MEGPEWRWSKMQSAKCNNKWNKRNKCQGECNAEVKRGSLRKRPQLREIVTEFPFVFHRID